MPGQNERRGWGASFEVWTIMYFSGFYVYHVQPHFDFLVKKYKFKVDPPDQLYTEGGVTYSTNTIRLVINSFMDSELAGVYAHQWNGRYWQWVNILKIIRARSKGTKYELPFGLWGEKRKYSDDEVLRLTARALRHCVPEFFKGQLELPSKRTKSSKRTSVRRHKPNVRKR